MAPHCMDFELFGIKYVSKNIWIAIWIKIFQIALY